jgi:hypothetical protein
MSSGVRFSWPGFDGAVISLDDCIAMCGLDTKEIEAIAEHEHIPEISATALADHLLHQVGGAGRIREMILDGIRIAVESGRGDRAADLLITLSHFLEHHPEAQASGHAACFDIP